MGIPRAIRCSLIARKVFQIFLNFEPGIFQVCPFFFRASQSFLQAGKVFFTTGIKIRIGQSGFYVGNLA